MHITQISSKLKEDIPLFQLNMNIHSNPNEIVSQRSIEKSLKDVSMANGDQNREFKTNINLQNIQTNDRVRLSRELRDQNVQNSIIQLLPIKIDDSIESGSTIEYRNRDGFDKFYEIPLLNEDKLKKIIDKNPWDVDINPSLDEFLGHIKRSDSINFRIGGRLLHSASHVVRVKSDIMVNDSANVRDTFQECIVEEIQMSENDDVGSYEDELLNSAFDSIEKSVEIQGSKNRDKNKTTRKKGLTDEELIEIINSRENLLISTGRCLYSKVELSELSKSLDLVIKNRLLRERKQKFKDKNDQSSEPESRTTPKNLILPTNFIKNKEEARMFMEQMIEKTFFRILSLFNGEPIPFYKLIDEINKDEVVHCLIYLLHLGNRRKIDVYQKIIDPDNFEGTRKRKKNDENVISVPQIDEIIYVVPIK